MRNSALYTLTLSISLFLNSILVAHLIDFDYISPEERYSLERAVHEKTNGTQFPSFEHWKDTEERRLERFHDWLSDGINASFDWTNAGSEYNGELNAKGRD